MLPQDQNPPKALIHSISSVVGQLRRSPVQTFDEQPRRLQEMIYSVAIQEVITAFRAVGKFLREHGGKKIDVQLVVGAGVDYLRERGIGGPL